MSLYDKDGRPMRRIIGFKGGHMEPHRSDEWVTDVSVPDRVRREEESWRPGGMEWEPMYKQGRPKS